MAKPHQIAYALFVEFFLPFTESAFFFVYFLFLVWVSKQFFGIGSDHYFYAYYVDLHRTTWRYIKEFPNFLNRVSLVDPQIFYKCLATLPSSSLPIISRLLNPLCMSALMVATFSCFPTLESGTNFGLTLLIAFTPQYFYGNNARLAGLGTRGLGMLILFFVLCLHFYARPLSSNIPAAIILIFLGYLIWHLSLFAQQAFLFISFFYAIISHDWELFITFWLSLGLFLLLHPSYGFHFLKIRLNYAQIYSRYMAEPFLLKLRPSIWGDWIKDFWMKKNLALLDRLKYVYGNSLFIVLFLNPLSWFALFGETQAATFERYAAQITAAGFCTFLLTSFRGTRFLGEPERYLEAIIPFSSAVGFLAIHQIGDESTWLYFLIYFGLINLGQMGQFVATQIKKKKRKDEFFRPEQFISDVEKVVQSEFKEGVPTILCNHMDFGKMILRPQWNFVFFWPTIFNIGNIPVKDIISQWPYFTKAHIVELVNSYEVSLLITDPHYEKYEETDWPFKAKKIFSAKYYDIWRIQ